MADSPTNTQELWDYMFNHMRNDMDFGSIDQDFLPRTAFEAATSRDVIRKIVAQDEELFMTTKDQEDFVRNVYQHGRKLFAICVYSELPMTCLKTLLDDKITDAMIPITGDQCRSIKHKKKIVTTFLPNQKRFHSAYFAMDDMQSLTKGMSIPIDYSTSKSKLGKGSFGDVWKVQIHPDHCGFSSGANRQNQFAMKVTEQGPYGLREQNFHQAMASAELKHPHLAKCLTSFTFGDQYYMIYELADCDLEAFMRNHPDSNQVLGLTQLSIAQQLYGLAAALELVHDQGDTQDAEPGKLNVKRENGGKTGYIHDIKPENILLYVYDNNKHWLRLSDFSCAKVVEWVVIVSGYNGQRESRKTQSHSGTPTYTAPESLENRTSRPYDIWTLGCVYLEVLIWYTEGYEELCAFRNSREAPLFLPDGPKQDGFFCIEDGIKCLRKPVLEKIEKMQRICTGELKAIIDTIPDLLRMVPKSRPTAAQLVKRLAHLHEDFDPTPTARNPGSPRTPFMVTDSDSDSDLGEMFIVTKPT